MKRSASYSPQGTFPTGTVTMQGKPYKLVGATLQGRKTYHTLKNSAGDYKDFEHDHLMTLIDKPTVLNQAPGNTPAGPMRAVPFQYK